MTAETLIQDRTITHGTRGGPLLGFGTVFRKEVTEWLRGRAAFIVAAVAIASAIFTTVIPFIVKATGEAGEGLALTNDPTANVLLGWRGAQTYAVIAVLATMALITAERDRGTLSWSLSNPVSPSSFIAAKFCAAVAVVGTAIVIVPVAISAVVATIAYGAVPNLGRVAVFAGLFLTVPIFYVGLNVTLGSFVKSTAGVAGIALLVMFLPSAVGGLFPIVNEASPTSIGTWAWLTATGANRIDAHPRGLGDLDGRPCRRSEAHLRAPGVLAGAHYGRVGRTHRAFVRLFRFRDRCDSGQTLQPVAGAPRCVASPVSESAVVVGCADAVPEATSMTVTDTETVRSNRTVRATLETRVSDRCRAEAPPGSSLSVLCSRRSPHLRRVPCRPRSRSCCTRASVHRLRARMA